MESLEKCRHISEMFHSPVYFRCLAFARRETKQSLLDIRKDRHSFFLGIRKYIHKMHANLSVSAHFFYVFDIGLSALQNVCHSFTTGLVWKVDRHQFSPATRKQTIIIILAGLEPAVVRDLAL